MTPALRPTTSADDVRWMRLALTLAARGLGNVWPNPAVGCVIVAEGRVVGRGWTRAGGRPHAEAEALARAGAAARGATAYVTLEPCAHHGRTPPCAEALVAAGIGRVVSALEDPDPRVAGRGHARLRAEGIAVETGLCAGEAARLQQGFLTRLSLGRPMVTLKLALSLDGRIATANGESRWITGPAARRHVHALRARHDAVLVGAGTALADDPELTVRGLGIERQPVRVVADTHLRLAPGSALGRGLPEAPLWLLHGPGADTGPWANIPARLLEVAADARTGRLDPVAALGQLGAEGLTRVLCEGGGQLGAALLGADLVDEICVYSAGIALGQEGRPGLGELGLEALADAPRFRLAESMALGPDLLHVWRRAEAV